MGLFKTIGKIAAGLGGFAVGGPLGAAGALALTRGGASGGGAIISPTTGIAALGKKKRRRRRRRITARELEELILLKSVVGPRSPLLTIAGIKILGRGG